MLFFGTEGSGFTPLKVMKYPGGETQVDVSEVPVGTYVKILCKFESNDDLINILLVKQALENKGCKIYQVIMPYMPYARQDRISVATQPFSLKVISEMLRGISLVVHDIHSGTLELIHYGFVENVKQISIWFTTIKTFKDTDKVVLVAPDKGALEKTAGLAGNLNIPYICGEKVRDPDTGKLSGFKVNADNLDPGKHYVIVDDICDGGGTFIGLGKVLRELGAKKLTLCVTHGIFSKGLTDLSNMFDDIYTTASLPNIDDTSDYNSIVKVY